MESSLTESVQQLVRPGKCVDLYYPDPETASKQCFRTCVNTRYVQQFANLSGGSSVFTIPPNNGVGDICVIMELPAIAAPGNASLAIPRGWGYGLIKQVSFRYGGSSQFFLSQQQLLQNALRKTPNSGSRDDMFSLGGNASAGATLATPQRAYVWLSLPHTVPTSTGKLPPLPSDLLTQQIQVTVELNPISSIFSVAAGGSTAAIPTALNFAEFQLSQIILENQGDALARRVDMTSHALSFPVEFTQQEVIIPLANAASQQVTLTGFRSGECRNVQVWITKDGDAPAPAVGAIINPFKWYAPEDLICTYAGEVYARFDKGVGQLWNLVNARQSPAVNEVLVSDAGGGACAVTTPFLGQWLELPFAQPFDDLTAHSTYTAGKPITNGLINLTFNLPQSLPAAADLKLHVSYNYNAVLTFSQGTCDYVI